MLGTQHHGQLSQSAKLLSARLSEGRKTMQMEVLPQSLLGTPSSFSCIPPVWSFNVPIWHICVHLLLQPINHQPISSHCPVLRDPHHSSHTTRDHQSPLSERSHVTMLRGLMFPGSRRPAVGGNGPIFQQSLTYLFFHEAFWAHRAHGNLLYGWSVKKTRQIFFEISDCPFAASDLTCKYLGSLERCQKCHELGIPAS